MDGLVENDDRAPLWRRIRDTLAEEIRQGRWPTGDRLPSEAALSTRFGVNRHTLRRAMAALQDEGLVHVRRGAGATVTWAQTDYPISRRTRFTANLLAAGRRPGRRFLRLETVAASRAEADALALPKGAQVHVCEGLTEADGVPVALARAVFPAAPLRNLLAELEATGSITQALARCGVPDYTRKWTRLTAQKPGAIVANHLMIHDQTPLIRAESLNLDPMGRPVEYGQTWFVTDRMPVFIGDDPDREPE